jgi:hypothetical protein
MNEVDEFLAWAITTRQSLDSVINKMEEKIELDEDDLAFLEKLYIVFNQGEL